MSFSLLDWIIFVSVPLLAWLIGNSKRQTGSWRGYFLATGNLQTSAVAATYFGANLTFTAIFLILSEEGYKRGVWVFSVPIFWLLGTILFVVLYPRMKKFISKGLTLHQTIGSVFDSSSLQRWASLWTILAFVGTSALEFYGGIKLLKWANLPLFVNVTIALLLAFIVSAFTVRGGFRGVAFADIFLDVAAALGAGILAYYYFHTPLAQLPPAEVHPPLHLPLFDNVLFVIGMGVIFLPFQFCTLDSWQRLGAWYKRDKNPSSWLLSGSIVLSLVYCVPILIGIFVRNSHFAVPEGSHPLKVFLDYMHILPGLLGLVFAGFIAAVFSTVDELLNCSSLSLLFDVLQLKRIDPDRNKDQEYKIVSSGKFYTSFFGFLAAIIALLALAYERQISDIAIAVFSGQVVFVVPLFYVLFKRNKAPRRAFSAKLAMIIAFFSSLLSVLLGWIFSEKSLIDAAPLLGLILALISFIISSTTLRKENK